MTSFTFIQRVVPPLGIALIVAASIPAAETPSQPFTLSQALAEALLKSPVLQAQAYESRVVEARALQAGIRSNPELSVDIENVFGTGALSGVKGLETTVQLSQLIDLGGSRDRRVAVAEREGLLIDAATAAQRIEVMAEVARRFTEAAADGERLVIARQARGLGEEFVTAVQARVAAGLVSTVDLNRARNALAVLRIDEEHAEHELAVCRQFLAAVIGEPRPSFGEIRADLLNLPDLPSFDVLAARLETSPMLARFEVEAGWHEAREQLARSLRRSGLRVSGGIRRVEDTDDVGLVAGLSMPLPVRDQNQGDLREARERRAQLGPAREARKLELHATLFEVHQEMHHARLALEVLTGEIIPSAEDTLRLVRRGYEEGRFASVDLLEAQKELISLRRQTVDHAATFHLHLITIERLLGAMLPAATATN